MPTRPTVEKLDTYDEELGRRRCTATSRRSGDRCRNAPIAGAPVCRMHGGAAPQVKRAAALRLAALVDPSIDALEEVVQGPTAEWKRLERGTAQRASVWKRVGYAPGEKRAAAEAILDRAGYPRRTAVDLDDGRERLLARLRELAAEHGYTGEAS